MMGMDRRRAVLVASSWSGTAVLREQEDRGRNRSEHEHANCPIQSDQSEDIAISKCAAAKGWGNLVPIGRKVRRWMSWRGHRPPRVTAEAAVPTGAAEVASEHIVLVA